jgi:hypothetical protein
VTNDSKRTTADYVRMAEDCLDQSWEAGESHEFRALSVARAQVYATLAVAMSTAAVAIGTATREELAHFEALEAMERQS